MYSSAFGSLALFTVKLSTHFLQYLISLFLSNVMSINNFDFSFRLGANVESLFLEIIKLSHLTTVLFTDKSKIFCDAKKVAQSVQVKELFLNLH